PSTSRRFGIRLQESSPLHLAIASVRIFPGYTRNFPHRMQVGLAVVAEDLQLVRQVDLSDGDGLGHVDTDRGEVEHRLYPRLDKSLSHLLGRRRGHRQYRHVKESGFDVVPDRS